MQAVEFKTIIQDGIIQVPEVEALTAGTEVKVIVMWSDAAEPPQESEQFLMNEPIDNAYQDIFIAGKALPDEKPSDFAGIWKNRKKISATQLRQRAWARRK
jgi:hypothetical protein